MEEKVHISAEHMASWHQSDAFMMERLVHHACGSTTPLLNFNNICDALRNVDIFFKDNVNTRYLRQERVLLLMRDSIERTMDLCPLCKHKDLKMYATDHVLMNISVTVSMKIWSRHVLTIRTNQNETFFTISMGASRLTL